MFDLYSSLSLLFIFYLLSFSLLSCFDFLFSSSSGSRIANLSCLLAVNVGALILSLIAAIIVPATLTSIVVIPKDKRIDCSLIALCILDVGDSVEFFADGSLNDDVLLVLVVPSVGFEVELVVVGIRDHDLGLFHVH